MLESNEAELALLAETLATNEEDAFEYRKLSGTIATTLIQCRPPFTFAICAPWGGGKSSFLRFLREALSAKDRYALVVHFNAWHASIHDDIVGSFVLNLCRSLEAQTDGAIKALPDFDVGSFVEAVKSVVKTYGLFSRSAKLAHAVADEVAARRAVSLERKVNAEAEFSDAFRELCSCLNQHRLAPYVLIDELDRCAPPVAVRMIEGIRMFFSGDIGDAADAFPQNLGQVPFKYVLAIDERYIVNAFASQYDLSAEDAERYIAKFINHAYHFPVKNWGRYLRALLSHSRVYGRWFAATSLPFLVELIGACRVESIRDVRRMLASVIIWQRKHYVSRSPVSIVRLLPETAEERQNVLGAANGYLFIWAAIKILFTRETQRCLEIGLISKCARLGLSTELEKELEGLDGGRLLEFCRRVMAIAERMKRELSPPPDSVYACVDAIFNK